LGSSKTEDAYEEGKRAIVSPRDRERETRMNFKLKSFDKKRTWPILDQKHDPKETH
jgi:hypothetical protein